MSSVTKGTAREMKVGRQLAAKGYRWCKVSRSGQAPIEEKDQRIRADLIAFAPRRSDCKLPNLVVAVGGVGKRLGVEFAELRGDGLPITFAPLLVMFKPRKMFFYTDEDSRHFTLQEALEALLDG